MNEPVIETEGLSKRYRLGTKKGISLLRTLFGGKEKEDANTLWALRDISLEINKGEVIGLIGKNGSGKSTLLKLLSRITEPTEGKATIRGRVRSLLEVGTGFHPELSGRENIYLNGSFLGMKRSEIREKFDDIVEFADMGRFLDTPVKRYSSGMYVRLAFSVAAHLEPEILLVDEVLAVGDVAFQKKCLGKLEGVSKEGRTVILVSHNMASIRSLCTRTIALDSGKIIFDGETKKGIDLYLGKNLHEGGVVNSEALEASAEKLIFAKRESIRALEVKIQNTGGEPINSMYSTEPVEVTVTYECLEEIEDLRIVVFFTDDQNNPLIASQNTDDKKNQDFHWKAKGVYRSTVTLPANFFSEHRYYLSVHFYHARVQNLNFERILPLDIQFQGYHNVQIAKCDWAWFRPQLGWKTEPVPTGNDLP
jgi:lipopolysaccharide transport system ATP-binding protein